MARDLTKHRAAPAPAHGPRQQLRYWWNQLTSMRTTLLLFCLAIAAITGSLSSTTTSTSRAAADSTMAS